MESEVIRFMTLRPTQVTKSQSNLTTVSLLDPNDNVIKDALIKAGIFNIERNKIMPVAKAYIANPAFYNDVAKITPSLRDFINWTIYSFSGFPERQGECDYQLNCRNYCT